MYESPIKLSYESHRKDFLKKQDAYILQEVVRLGVDIDKEELMRALKYDRNQYEAGYADGQRDAVVHGRWIEYRDFMTCSVCEKDWYYGDNNCDEFHCCPNCGAFMDLEDEE